MTIQVAQRIGRALGVSSATRLTELDTALREYVRSVGPAASIPVSGSFDASQVVSGTFANARVAASNVTQHQAALAIAYAQLTGVPATFTPSAHTHPNGDLTGYTAADVLAKLLTVDGAASGLDADLLDGISSAAFAQKASNETVSGQWDFSTGKITNGTAIVTFNKALIADDATTTFTVPSYGVVAIVCEAGGAPNHVGIFFVGSNGQGTLAIVSGPSFSLGTTANPDVDGNLNVWMSAAATLSVKNRRGDLRNFAVVGFGYA